MDGVGTSPPPRPTQCSVCQAGLEGSTHVLECGHEFHTDCIVRWFRSSTAAVTCPICRAAPAPAAACSGSEDEGSDNSGAEWTSSISTDVEGEEETVEVPLHEREMNELLREHLHFARRRFCPAATKMKVRKYREARAQMISKRRKLFLHDRKATGRYVDLKRGSVRLRSKFETAQSRFARRAMILLSTPLP